MGFLDFLNPRRRAGPALVERLRQSEGYELDKAYVRRAELARPLGLVGSGCIGKV